jgi:hypothetical protein
MTLFESYRNVLKSISERRRTIIIMGIIGMVIFRNVTPVWIATCLLWYGNGRRDAELDVMLEQVAAHIDDAVTSDSP